MQANISRQAAIPLLKQPSQPAWYLLLVVITIVMSILPLVLVSLHPQTILVSDSRLDHTVHQEVRPLFVAQIGIPERWCITPGHIPHPVPTPTLGLWLAIGLALSGFCIIQACIRLRCSADQRMLQTHGPPPTPPPRPLLFLS